MHTNEEIIKMQELKFEKIQQNLCLLVSASGDTFCISAADVLSAADAIKEATRTQHKPLPKVSPKVIQDLIRSGMDAEQVAQETGANLETVRRFEVPILSERSYILKRAQSVIIRPSDLEAPTLRAHKNSGLSLIKAVNQRLKDLGIAEDLHSWNARKKDGELWEIELEFILSGTKHKACWRYDTTSHSLLLPSGAALSIFSKDELFGRAHLHIVDTDFGQDAPAQDAPLPHSAHDTPAEFRARDLNLSRNTPTEFKTNDLIKALDSRTDGTHPRGVPNPYRANPHPPEENFEYSSNNTLPFEFADSSHTLDPTGDELPPETPQFLKDDFSKPKKTKRNSLPTWDEIVFGATKA